MKEILKSLFLMLILENINTSKLYPTTRDNLFNMQALS